MSGDNDDSGRTDPLARLLFEPPTLATDSLDFLLLARVLPVLRYGPPSYMASQRPDLKELAKTRCLDRHPQSKIVDTKVAQYLSYLHGEGRTSIDSLHNHFAAHSAVKSQFGHGCARQLNDLLVEGGLGPIRYNDYYLRALNKEYFSADRLRYPRNVFYPSTI